MKSIKQKLLNGKLSIIAFLFFALILFVASGFTMKKASAIDEAQATFSTDNFAMCEGAEVRTDGEKSGIRFVASLGDALPSETDYANLTYNVMIVPKAYITHYEITGEWYTALDAALKADDAVSNKTIITMQAKPFYSDEVVAGEEGYYIRGTLSNVKYDNINVEWFGMAYLTYTDGAGETQYVYAQIPETGANVRSLVYCASGYLNIYDYSAPEKAAEKEVLTNFVAQGINNAVGNVSEEDKNDNTYLNAGVAAIEQSASEQVNLLPEKTQTWTTGVPAGVKLHVIYNAEDSAYASVSDAGIITGVAGDNNAATTRNVTMKALGVTYTRPVHVYNVTAALANATEEIFSKGGLIGDTTFVNSAELTVTAEVDGVATEETLAWTNTNTGVATVADGVVTAVAKSAYFASETVTVSFSFAFAGETFSSDECAINVSFPVAYKEDPIAYGDLLQNKLTTTGTTASEEPEKAQAVDTTELVKKDWTGDVSQFLVASNMQKDIFDTATNTTNVYDAFEKNEAGEGKQFVVVSSDGYGFMVTATVVTYAIADKTQLDYFFNSYIGDTGNSYSTDGTYVIMSADVEDYKRSPVQGTATRYAGTFDGRGYAIKFVQYDDVTSGVTSGVPSDAWTKHGVFGGRLVKNATIKNTAFIGIMKNSNGGGGLVNAIYSKDVVIDNCYVELQFMGGTTAEQGGICLQANGATISNVIVNIKYSKNTTGKVGTICSFEGTSKTDTDTKANIINCFSISVENVATNVGYDSTNTDNIYNSANKFAEDIGDALPATFNSYWTYTESGLSFGDTPVLTFTQE
ncbi:MAG: hypothetical protein IJA89_09000 [Clostridia bacterium]|nr:hypothetical protein [Clostridia bacterium]